MRNQKYQTIEWLYRYERKNYNAEGIRDMMLREEAMMVGSKQEQDSIKALTVQLERRKHAERTHVYFRPSYRCQSGRLYPILLYQEVILPNSPIVLPLTSLFII